MFKVFLILFGLSLWSCQQRVANSTANKPAAEENKSFTNPSPKPTPEAFISECTKNRTIGLAKGINIAPELCFDDSKPVDAKEKSSAKIGNSPQTALMDAFEVQIEKLPPEVQRIVKLTLPETDFGNLVFNLIIIPTPDEKSNNRLVKSYSYSSSSKARLSGRDPNHHSWLFKRQNNLLKLVEAQIDTTK